MELQSSPLFKTIDKHFRLLDELSASAGKIIKSEDDKGIYETKLMYVFRKYKAAQYHFDNVNEHLANDRVVYREIMGQRKMVEILPGARIKSSASWSADYYVYELSAFLEALKSALDFLAVIFAMYLPGIQADSIRTFIRLAERDNRRGLVFDIVTEKLDWLINLREYRHHLVHRMVISTQTRHEVQANENLSTIVNYPVIIPETTPAFVLDTRASRMQDDGESHRFDLVETEVRIKSEDENEKIVEHSVEIIPASGYTSIEEFMTLHMGEFEDFFIRTINSLNSLSFETVNAN